MTKFNDPPKLYQTRLKYEGPPSPRPPVDSGDCDDREDLHRRSLARLEHILSLTTYVRKHYPATPGWGVIRAARYLAVFDYVIPRPE